MNQTLLLPHGYSATIEQDLSPENPYSSRYTDCATPILVFNLDRNCSRMESYGTTLSLRDIYWLIPSRCFGPKGRAEIIESMGIEHDVARYHLNGSMRKARAEDWQNAIAEVLPENPASWSEAEKYFEMLEFLCTLANIPCKWEESTGYSQGDAAWVFVAAMPAWRELVGWNPPNREAEQEDLQISIDLWSAWAWGDVYGVSELLRPDSTEVPDSSCWGFYGDDHGKSGLRDHLIEHVNHDITYLARETAESFDAACRDIVTAA